MKAEERKFGSNLNQGTQTSCQSCQFPCPPPPPLPPCPYPLPPPVPCPQPHGQIFKGCIAYINSYIDVRMRQLYIKLKQIIQKLIGSYSGPWDQLILRDIAHPENLYKICIKNGNLCSDPYVEDDNQEVQPDSNEIEL